MIGAFARMVGHKDRVVSVEETTTDGYAVRTKQMEGYAEHAAARDAPPERFVEKVSDEGGDVFFAPVLDVLRDTLRRARGRDALTTEPEGTTRAPRTDAP